MSPTYFPPKQLIAMGLTSDVKRLFTSPLTVLRCYICDNYSLKLGVADSISGNPAKTSSGNNSDGKDDTWRYWFLGVFNLK